MSVGYRDDDNAARLNVVHDAERVAAQKISTSAVIERWPSFGLFQDRPFGSLKLDVETLRGRRTSLRVPASARLGLFQSLGEVVKIECHPELPSECGDGPRPRERCSPDQT